VDLARNETEVNPKGWSAGSSGSAGVINGEILGDEDSFGLFQIESSLTGRKM